MTETLLRAQSHQWGPGKVHGLNEDGSKTLCGIWRRNCPGEAFDGFSGQIDCQRCITTIETASRREIQEREWAVQRQQREEEREQQNRQWRERYTTYLSSPEWAARRTLVLKRANNICEGCGRQRATRVQHVNWARVTHELLFDLVAVCESCSEVLRSSGEGNY